MKNTVTSLSVFFPCYNEEKNIAKTVTDAVHVLEKLKIKYEILIINDGSKDKTEQVAKRLVKENSHIRLINHEVNKGYGEALKTGFYSAKYDWIVFTDSDGQFDFSEITKFLEKTKNAPVVIGYRIERQDSTLRRLNGWGWNFLSNLLLGVRCKDVDCAFKLVKKEVIEKIPRLKSTRGGMISPELLAQIRRAGFKIEEVGVHHYPRTEGEQTGANLKVIFRSFADLFRLWSTL